MRYLKKKKVHELAVKILGGYNVPKCCECRYKAYGGFEWLMFYSGRVHISVTVRNFGAWVRVVVTNEFGQVCLDETKTGLQDLLMKQL